MRSFSKSSMLLTVCVLGLSAQTHTAQAQTTIADGWTWVGGSDLANQSAVYGAMGTPAAGNVPGARRMASQWVDGQGNLWLFGGQIWDATAGYDTLLNELWEYSPSIGQWVWVGGSNVLPTNCAAGENSCGPPGVYGTRGVAAVGNVPGGRLSSQSWTDNQGNLWLFSGLAVDSQGNAGWLSDLWEFSPTTGLWTWIQGAETAPWRGSGMGGGVYGTLGSFAPGNLPGGRVAAATWVDSQGDLWLFGGYGFDSIGSDGDLNDLWKFSPTLKQWAWMGGASAISSRLIYDGQGVAGVYGSRGVAAPGNIPGGRDSAAEWTDKDGNFWIFGGWAPDTDIVESQYAMASDLWKYDVASGQWAWMAGPQHTGNDRQNPTRGVQGTPSAATGPGGLEIASNWTDAEGRLWLFGGLGNLPLGVWAYSSDLWMFEPDSSEWTWITGSGLGDGNTAGQYGQLGVASASNVPGSRGNSAAWTDANGDLWLFGGAGCDSAGTDGRLNDLWAFHPPAVLPAFTSPSAVSFSAGAPASFTVTTTGYPGTQLNETGALPGGVTFTDNGDGTATIAGTPTTQGTFPLGLIAANGTYPQTAQSLTLTVTQPTAVLLSPAAGSVLAGPTATFTWNTPTGASGYYLWIGTTGVGSNDLYNSAEKAGSSYTFSKLPTNGEPVYVRLITNVGGKWSSNDYTYTAATAATIVVPSSGSAFSGSSATFNWTQSSGGASGYYLWVGSTGVGSNNLYNSAEKTTTSYTCTGLPTNGETIYVRLITNFNGVWVSKDYTYVAATIATMISPAAGSNLGSSSVAFNWTSSPSATSYYLWIGSTGVGSNNIYNSAPKTVTSYTFNGMPRNGETIYVRLITNLSGVWHYNDYTYRAGTSPAVVTAPVAGSTFTGASVTFNWTAPAGATGCYLWIGSTGDGSNNIYNSAEKTTSTYTFTRMPVNGEPIYVRLITNYNGIWVYNDYTYTAK